MPNHLAVNLPSMEEEAPQVPAAARPAEIVGSNAARGMYVCMSECCQ